MVLQIKDFLIDHRVHVPEPSSRAAAYDLVFKLLHNNKLMSPSVQVSLWKKSQPEKSNFLTEPVTVSGQHVNTAVSLNYLKSLT